ncbi:hypothetical protein EDC04DRAFT_2602745 [Pisolithus marmoratus]|nr:hypothetical protein EDC04DRAFT_2602745 [Pisolithus marmoratus]
MAKETTPKSSWPKRGIHGSNRDKSQDELSNKCMAAGRSKKTVKLKDESQKEASRKRALTLMDSESSQQEAQPPKKVPKWTLHFQCDSPDKDLESSDHKVDVDELEQEDEVDELEDDDNMPQSDKHGHIDQEESRDKVHKDNDDDDGNSDDDEYIKENPDSTNKQPADLDDEIVVNFHADNKGKQQSKVTEVDDKVKHKQGGRPSSCCPHGSKLSKTSLASFESANICHLAKLGHHHLHQHVAMVEAFPFPGDKDELCWKLIQESAVKEPGLEQVLAEVEKEQNMKERLLDYIWGATMQVRGELIAKARLAAPTAYGLQGESLKGNALFDVLKLLIQQGKLIHSGINPKSMTCDESKPWKNPIFLQLIKMQWWGPKGEGRCLGSDPATNPYLNALATTLALIATVVECVLTGLFSGGTIDFNENVYCRRWNHYMKMLAEFKMRSPTYLQMVQESIQQGVGVHPVQKVSPPVFDFSGLEEAAKMELEGAIA